MLIKTTVKALSYFFKILVFLKQGLILKKYVSLGNEKACLSRKRASSGSKTLRQSHINWKLSDLDCRTPLMASGIIRDPNIALLMSIYRHCIGKNNVTTYNGNSTQFTQIKYIIFTNTTPITCQ